MTADEKFTLDFETTCLCECGGHGPNDEGACYWCRRYHALVAGDDKDKWPVRQGD